MEMMNPTQSMRLLLHDSLDVDDYKSRSPLPSLASLTLAVICTVLLQVHELRKCLTHTVWNGRLGAVRQFSTMFKQY